MFFSEDFTWCKSVGLPHIAYHDPLTLVFVTDKSKFGLHTTQHTCNLY